MKAATRAAFIFQVNLLVLFSNHFLNDLKKIAV